MRPRDEKDLPQMTAMDSKRRETQIFLNFCIDHELFKSKGHILVILESSVPTFMFSLVSSIQIIYTGFSKGISIMSLISSNLDAFYM